MQPRFASFVTPRRRYVCLLRAIATVLAIKAGDTRLDAGVQRRADAALRKMEQSADCFAAGLAGDYGEVCLEFLRYFDVHDHDPARTAQQVQQFTTTLRQLFIEGYVLCSEGETEVPGWGVRKTLSQIAVENMEEPLILTYGKRSWSLWGKRVDWHDCKEALASIRGVAKDVIDRLNAEFHEQDLYMAYRAFDLDAWAKVVSASTPDALTKNLKAALGKMGKALEASTDWNTWHGAARLAIRARTRSTNDVNLQYRLAWRAAMSASDFPSCLTKVVSFYLATWDGTGAVERGLGRDAAHQKQHVGKNVNNDTDADVYSALLEMHLDGPQTEPEMFTSTDGVLHLTDFSRACAGEWVLQHGRRFTCYKQRKNAGCRFKCRRKGTDQAVQALARAAYQTRRKMAESDAARTSTSGKAPKKRRTIFGIDRAKLMVNVNAVVTPAASKKARNFRANTLAKRAEKVAAETWCGWGSGVPKPRLGGAAAVEAATRNAAAHAMRARLWLSRRGRRQADTRQHASKSSSSSSAQAVTSNAWKRRKTTPGTKSSSASGSKPSSASTPGTKSSSGGAAGVWQAPAAMCKLVVAKFANKNQFVVKSSLEDMIRQRIVDPDTTTLLSWLKAVSQGGLVKCAGKQMALDPGTWSNAQVQISKDFATKYPSLSGAIHTAAKNSKGKWGVNSSSAAKTKNPKHLIEKKRDVATFLLHARRVAVANGAGGLAACL